MNQKLACSVEPTLYTEKELEHLDPEKVPLHIAIVMDGNRRWARGRGEKGEMGHWHGAEQLDLIVRAAAELGVKALTAYAFSTENWNRSPQEVALLMQLLEAYLINRREKLVKEGVCLHSIGDLAPFPDEVKRALEETKQATKQCTRIDLVLALNYGGRDEIRRAVMKMAQAEKEGRLKWEQLTEEMFGNFLDTAPWPDPELFIRPSGVQRLSNFLIWQMSYSEIYISDAFWPDFSEKELLKAVIDYQSRNRRFGI